MPADADPSPPGPDERWARMTAGPWLAIALGVILLISAYAALRTALEVVSIGGLAPGDVPRPWPAGLTSVLTLSLGAGLAWTLTMRRIALAGVAAALAMLAPLAADAPVVITWAALAATGVSAGGAAVAFRWHARSTHWRRRRAALIAVVLATATCLATGDILAVLALLVVLPLSASSAALLLPNEAP